MNLTNTSTRYGALSIGLHWLMFLLIAAGYTCIELRVLLERGSDTREALKTWHYMLGLTVFVLVWLRLLLTLLQPRPAIAPPLSGVQQWLARIMHWLLYALMIGMPIAKHSSNKDFSKRIRALRILSKSE